MRYAEAIMICDNIADDGVVDDTERPDFDEIVSELMEMFSTAMSVRFSQTNNENTGEGRN